MSVSLVKDTPAARTARYLATLTFDQADRFYREGRMSQDDYEAFRYGWAAGRPDSSDARGWQDLSDAPPAVLEIVAHMFAVPRGTIGGTYLAYYGHRWNGTESVPALARCHNMPRWPGGPKDHSVFYVMLERDPGFGSMSLPGIGRTQLRFIVSPPAVPALV